MGPQPFGCGRYNLPACRYTALCFNGAATFRLRKAARVMEWEYSHAWLQWGRNLSVAEGMSAVPGRAVSAGFNGAATFRLRKAEPSMDGPPGT